MLTRHVITDFSIDPLDDAKPLPILLSAFDILKGYHWWVSFGTLLTLYRDKCFAPGDTDVDVCVLGNINRWVSYAGFELVMTMDEEWTHGHPRFKDVLHQQTIYRHSKSGILLDITHWHPVQDAYMTKRLDEQHEEEALYTIPEHIHYLDTMKVLAHSVPVPGNIEGVLTNLYGDWQTPNPKGKPTWHKL